MFPTGSQAVEASRELLTSNSEIAVMDIFCKLSNSSFQYPVIQDK